MAKKPDITTIASGYYSRQALNNNFENLQTGFDNTLSLDGSTPNAMGADLDLNGNDILNAGVVNTDLLKLDGTLVGIGDLNAAGATLSSISHTGNGSTVAFSTGYQAFITDNTQVYVDGVYQNKAGYSISGTTLTFSEAPPLNSSIEIVVARTLDFGATTAANVGYIDPGSNYQGTNVQSVLDEIAPKLNPSKAHHSLSVINASQAALQRFNLTKQGTGSAKVIQGFASDPYTNELFTLHVTTATVSPYVPEKAVINKFEADGTRIQTSYRWTGIPLTTLGHQELEISWDKSGTRWFWTGENKDVTNQARYIKRFQIADGAGTELTVSNVQQFQVFTDAETTGVETGSATSCISLDGRYLVTEYSGSNTNLVKVFETATLMNGGAGDYSTQQVYSWTFDLDTAVYPLQSMACDGSYVYIFTGNIVKGPTLKVFVYTVTGEFVEEINDFTVGETEAQGDGAGTGYELEGAGWIWHGGQPMLACSIASGDSGTRVNRIWVLGAKVSVTAYGDGNKPAFISQGTNDMAVPDGEALRLGHYNGATDTFIEGAKINSFNQLEFTPVTGTWTASIFDASSGGNVSSTTDTAQYSKIGNMVWVNMSFSNVSISGMTSGNNFYIRGHGFTPTESAVFGTPVVSDFNLAAGDFNVVAEIATDGNITFREIQDSATNTIANVSQIDGADIRMSGWFKV